MSLKKQDLPALSPECRSREPGPAKRDFRQAGVLVVVRGLLLLSLAADSALAGAELGGRGGAAPHGSGHDDRLAGFAGEDRILGVADDMLSGGGGGDELYGGPGRDVLLGGAGDDFLETKDGERDYVDCGPGEDVASVDMRDRVSRTCETVCAA